MTAPVTPPTDDSAPVAPPAGGSIAAGAEAAPPRPPVPPPAPVVVPATWLLERGAPAIRARTLLDLVCVTGEAADAARRTALAHEPAVRLALIQPADGIWDGGMLALPATEDATTFAGVGTVPAVRRLAEYGWTQESPPLWAARRPLFRLLAQDDDPRFLYEVHRETGLDPVLVRRGRQRLREGAAVALAQAGFETDPRLRGAATRILERTLGFLKAEPPEPGEPLPEVCTPPTLDALAMLAHMPAFRNEHVESMVRLGTFLTRPAGKGDPKVRIGKAAVPQPQLVLGDPLAGVQDAEGKALPRVLAWLEVLARLGVLRRHEPWVALLDRLLDSRDADGRWTRPVGVPAPDPFTWPIFPLADGTDRASLQLDVTFRLALIARLAGRPLELH